MFFILSKLLAFLVKPFIWVLISLVIIPFMKSAKWKKRMAVLSIVLLLFFSNRIVFGECCRLWEIDGVKIESVGQYDVGIVLTGMAAYNNDLERISVGKAADRIWQALNLYKKGCIKKILISGDSGQVFDRGLDEAIQLKQDLVGWGIPATDIIVETQSQNTHENAEKTAVLLKNKYPELKRSLLITSALHMRRAKGCFQKEGVQLDVFSTDHMTSIDRKYFIEQFIIPDSATLTAWEALMKEWVGFLVYDLVGYI